MVPTMKRIAIALCVLLLIPSSSIEAFSISSQSSSSIGTTTASSAFDYRNNRNDDKYSRKRQQVVTYMSSTVKERNEIGYVMPSRSCQDDETNIATTAEDYGEVMIPMTMMDEQSTGMELDFVVENSSLLQKKSEPTADNPLEPLLWRGVILILCALWGSNFAAAKLVMAEPGVDSSLYALARFTVAAAALLPGAVGAVKKADLDWETIKGGLICGSWVAFGYLGQTVGLQTTTASKSCVICSMHCVFVAALAEYWRVSNSPDEEETKYDLMRLVPAAIAVLGVAIVELKGAGGAPTIGDALSFAQPIGFGMGYLLLENLMVKKPEAAYPVTTLKLMVVATASLLMYEFSPVVANGFTDISFRIPDFSPILHSPLALGGILYTGLITTAAALWVESIAFAKVPATDASIILTTEPLIAAGIGAVTLGETFGSSDYVGASLIIGACALAILLDEGNEHEKPVSEL